MLRRWVVSDTVERYDLIAIGGGTAGLVTAGGAALLGLRSALVEREALGGDCLWTGCVPSKALIASARLVHAMRHAHRLGLTGAAPTHAFEVVMERMRKVRDRVAVHDDPERFRKMGVDVVFGAAQFETSRRLRVNDRVLESPRIVVATGAVPSVPPIDGLKDAGFLTHVSAFDQDTLPRRIAVLGGGPIGVEFAQVYARLGARVIVFEVLPHLLSREEHEASDFLLGGLNQEGIVVRTESRVDKVERRPDGTKVVHVRDRSGRTDPVEVDEVFVATGRRANTDGLGLEEIGVGNDGEAVRVDERLRTNVKGVWAAGDVTGGLQFTHVAEYQAKRVLRDSVAPLARKVSYDAVPSVTYTDPEVARVGLTESEARARYGEVAVYRHDFANLDRAIVDAETGGFVKIVTRAGGRIVGATIVASGAGNLIMPLVMSVAQRLKISALSQFVYPYPTMVEGVKRAADGYFFQHLEGRSGDWLKKVVRWLR